MVSIHYAADVKLQKISHRIIIILLVLVLGFITTKISLTRIEGNLKQLALSGIYYVDLAGVEDGDYIVSYSVFTVSVEVEITVKNHAIEEIELLKHKNGQGQGAEIILEKVIEAQSLKVDSVSGATYSSKTILLANENALI